MKHLGNLLILLFIFSISCNLKESWSELPEVTNIDSLKRTDFVLTLESDIANDKNVIYAPAFLYAWDEVKKELKSPVLVSDKNSKDFKLINQSKLYKNSLDSSEYFVEAELVDGAIIAKAFFNKTLPFPTKLHRTDNPIFFGNTKVQAFGMQYYDENLVSFSQILYYKDDDNFILKLNPKDLHHEIILVKGIKKTLRLSDVLIQTNALIKGGEKDKLLPKLSWKYEIRNDDIFIIPVVKFNIATNYKKLEGQDFLTEDQKTHFIETAFQRTGFIFDENGAVVESEVLVALDSIAAEPIKIIPKKMIFDTTFYIIIKRIDQKNPYFVMKVDNEELLIKE